MIPDHLRLYQVVVIFIATIMLYQGFEKLIKRDSSQTLLKFFIRLVIWGGMGAVALFPPISTVIARFIGIEGNTNAVILTGFLLVFLMVFKLLSAIEKLEKRFSELIQKDALKKVNKKK
jgi:hypothetical protein